MTLNSLFKVIEYTPPTQEEIEGATVGWFKDEVIAQNVALALEFYKEHNKS
jgi:hypothetical protein